MGGRPPPMPARRGTLMPGRGRKMALFLSRTRERPRLLVGGKVGLGAFSLTRVLFSHKPLCLLVFTR